MDSKLIAEALVFHWNALKQNIARLLQCHLESYYVEQPKAASRHLAHNTFLADFWHFNHIFCLLGSRGRSPKPWFAEKSTATQFFARLLKFMYFPIRKATTEYSQKFLRDTLHTNTFLADFWHLNHIFGLLGP